jgi:hypothetical protein
VEFVQEMRGKMVVHVGFGGYQNDLRSKCKHRIDLAKGQLFRQMQRIAGSTPSGRGAVGASASPRAASQSAGKASG